MRTTELTDTRAEQASATKQSLLRYLAEMLRK